MKKTISALKREKNKLVVSTVSLLLVFVLLAVAAFAWFSIGADNTKQVNVRVGNVGYEMTTAENIFFSSFDVDNGEEYYEDDYDEEDPPVPATSVEKVYIGGVEQTAIGGAYTYSLKKSNKSRITFGFLPQNATDLVTFVSSNPVVVTVSMYGTIRAVGEVGESAVIKATIHDRTPGTLRPDITVTVTVTVITNSDKEDVAFLPGNVNVLKAPLTVTNKSTVPSKARVCVRWDYNDFEGEGADNPRTKYNYSDLVTASSDLSGIVLSNSMKVPLKVNINSLTSHFKAVPPASKTLSFADENGSNWTIDILSFTGTELAAFNTAIQNGTRFTISEQNIDSAYIYLTYSDTEILSGDGDAGSAVPVATVPGGDVLTVCDKIITNENYASFSTRKLFVLSLTLQARQADWYSETNWFDVYCAELAHSCIKEP